MAGVSCLPAPAAHAIIIGARARAPTNCGANIWDPALFGASVARAGTLPLVFGSEFIILHCARLVFGY